MYLFGATQHKAYKVEPLNWMPVVWQYVNFFGLKLSKF